MTFPLYGTNEYYEVIDLMQSGIQARYSSEDEIARQMQEIFGSGLSTSNSLGGAVAGLDEKFYGAASDIFNIEDILTAENIASNILTGYAPAVGRDIAALLSGGIGSVFQGSSMLPPGASAFASQLDEIAVAATKMGLPIALALAVAQITNDIADAQLSDATKHASQFGAALIAGGLANSIFGPTGMLATYIPVMVLEGTLPVAAASIWPVVASSTAAVVVSGLIAYGLAKVIEDNWGDILNAVQNGADNLDSLLDTLDSYVDDIASGAIGFQQDLMDSLNDFQNSVYQATHDISDLATDLVNGLADAMANDVLQFCDPIVLDLDNNGLSLTALTSSHAYFDLRQEGMANLTGWVTGGDGILVQDTNSNNIVEASEVFGSLTQSGFEELATLDSNTDGKITSADTNWSQLKVWIDADEDGYTASGEMHTLASLGITEFNLTTSTSGSTINGNTVEETATFKKGGVDHTMGDILFNFDPTNSTYAGNAVLADEAVSLPALRGYGLMADTSYAMSENAQFLEVAQALATQANIDNFDAFAAAFKDYMYYWAGVENVTALSRGATIAANAKNLEFLEHYTGTPFISITNSSDPQYVHTWNLINDLFDWARQQMVVKYLVQTDSYLSQVAYYDLVNDQVQLKVVDTQVLIDAAPTHSANAAAVYWALLNFVNLPETAEGWATKLFILEQIEATGTDLTEAQHVLLNIEVGTSSGESISSYNVNTPATMLGKDGNDAVNGPGGIRGHMILSGGDGDDVFFGYDDSNTYIGGAGTDTVYSGGGADIVVFGAGDGQDIIVRGQNENTYNVYLFDGIEAEDVSYARGGLNGWDLVVTIGASGDQITSQQYFYTIFGEEFLGANMQIIFADGTIHSSAYINAQASLDASGSSSSDLVYATADDQVINALDGNDVIMSNSGTDEIYGDAGNDTIWAGEGNDTIIGGTGDDAMSGGIDSPAFDAQGVDTFVFAEGDGDDFISRANGDIIFFDDAGITAANVTYSAYGNHLLISYGSSGDSVAVEGFYSSAYYMQSQISEVRFHDTTVHSLAYIARSGMTFEGTSGADYFGYYALEFAQTIYGYADVDTLYGGYGDDYLDGGSGADSFYGSVGNDVYIIDDVSDYVFESVDSGTDTVQADFTYTLGSNFENLTLTGSSNLNGTGNSDNNTLTGNSGTNTLTGGAGNDTYVVGAGDVVVESASEGTDTVQSSVTYTITDVDVENLTLTGSSAINGTGNSSNNTLTGNSGVNTLTGGAGNDTYIISTGDSVVEGSSAGTDTVQTDITWTLATNFENLILTGSGNINGVGNSVANTITGNSGNNTLDGSTGNDTLIGGAGDDTYLVDSTSDVVTENDNEGTDTVQSTVTRTLGNYFENITLTGSSVVHATGNALDNTLSGVNNSSANTLTGGAGNDTYIIGTGDIVVEGASAGTDTVQSGSTYTLTSNVENLTLTGASVIHGTGNTLDNTLTGNSAANTLTGGAGNDTYVVGTGDVVVEAASSGTDIVQSDITWTLATNVENLTLTGSSNVNGIGNSSVNTITGNSGNNTLEGSTGADTMVGGAGDDVYLIDDAGDVVTESASAGTDTVQSSVAHTLGNNFENLTLSGASNINGTGNSLANTITGNSGINTLTGGAGNDTLNGGSGTDTLIGGTGNDTYIATTGDIITENADEGTDTVQSDITWTLASNVENLTLTGSGIIHGTGNTLNNTLSGSANSAANTLTGGAGNDTYVVGTGDIVVENASEGTDTVQSSVTWTLASNVENLTLTGSSAINGTGNSSDNTLTGNSGINTLTGGAGNDTYVVSTGDVVVEAASSGTDTIQSDITWTLASDFENLTLIGSSAINATGNSGNNTLTGNSAVNTLTGGAGNDTYIVSTGDIIVEAASAGTDTVQSDVSWTLGTDLENLTLAGYSAINATGNSAVNVITGNGANNTLDGSTGADTMIGGAGSDTYIVDNAGDVTTENASEGTDTVQTGLSWTLGSNIENLILTGASAVNGTGNSLDNVLTGNSATNTLTGGTGNDTYVVGTGDVVVEGAASGTDVVQSDITWSLASNVENIVLLGTSAIDGTGNSSDNTLTGNSAVNTLAGGTGNDTYVVGIGDTVVESASEGTDIVQSSITWTLSSNVENLTLTGASAVNGVGNGDANTIIGNVGANTLDGGAGNDTLIGGIGDDTYFVDSASDVITEDAYEGNDTVWASASFTLSSNVENLYVENGLSTITGTGNSLDNRIIHHGIGGTLYGGDGDDYLAGENYADVLYGEDDNDTLYGMSGDDTLYGGAGNDTLHSEYGADTLWGGTGEDIFVFDWPSGISDIDVIKDFSTAQNDVLELVGMLTYDPLTDVITDFIEITTSGANSILKIDVDGTGGSYSMTQIAALEGITGLTDEAALITSGHLVVS